MNETPCYINGERYFLKEEKLTLKRVIYIVIVAAIVMWALIGVVRICGISFGMSVAPNPMFVI